MTVGLNWVTREWSSIIDKSFNDNVDNVRFVLEMSWVSWSNEDTVDRRLIGSSISDFVTSDEIVTWTSSNDVLIVVDVDNCE